MGKTKKPRKRVVQMQLVPIDKVVPSNLKLNLQTVDAILQSGIDLKKFGVLPAYKDPKTKLFLLTDGNHRLYALRKCGGHLVPIAELTKEEFDYVKFSKNTIDLIVKI